MLNPIPQFMSLHCFTRKAIRWMAVGVCGLTLTGCQSVLSGPPRSQVRIIDVSPDAPEIDLYQNSSVIAYKLAFGSITSYVPVDPGAYTTTAAMSGTRQALATSKTKLATAGQYTVLISDVSSNLHQVMLQDQSQPAPVGETALRFLDEATRSGPMDIYLIPAGRKLSSVKPVVSGANFGGNTGYLNLPAGTYTLVMLPAGTVPKGQAEAAYSGAQVHYVSGSASTIVLMDQSPSAKDPGLEVIIAPDYVPPSED